jgi:sortase A
VSATATGRRRALGDTEVWPLRSGPKAPPVPLGEKVSIVSTSLTVLAIVLIWFLAQVLLLGGLEQGRAQDRLYDEFRAQLAGPHPPPTGGIIRPGAPVALLSIPSIEYEQVVSEGTSSGLLLSGPGHRRDTVLPGQAGVSLLYGRSSTFGKPFAAMLGKAAGKDMTVVTAQGKSVYTIGKVRRAGDPMPPAPTATGSRITMVTSDGSGRLGALTPGEVVYIDATIVTKAYVAPAGRLNAVGSTETAMASDTSVMPILALTLGVLALVTAGAVYSRQRFGLVRTWVITGPIVLAISWLASDLAMYLLPNLL